MHRYAFALFSSLVFAAHSVSAQVQTPTAPAYKLRFDQTVSGSVDRSRVAEGSPFPLNKRYEQFTESERKILRSFYEGMPDADDPPFPANGMKGIIGDVSKIAGSMRAEGDLTIFVSVNERGEATGVKLVKYPNVEVAKAVAFVLIKSQYKPASCSGQPCPQEFPFRVTLSTQ